MVEKKRISKDRININIEEEEEEKEREIKVISTIYWRRRRHSCKQKMMMKMMMMIINDYGCHISSYHIVDDYDNKHQEYKTNIPFVVISNGDWVIYIFFLPDYYCYYYRYISIVIVFRL